MLSTRFLALGVAAALLIWGAPCTMACSEISLAICTTAYQSDLGDSNVEGEGATCGVMKKYYSCAKSACGEVPEAVSTILETAQSTLNTDCDLSGSSGTATVSLLSLLSMAVVFLAARILK